MLSALRRALWLLLAPALLALAGLYVKLATKRRDSLATLILPFFAVILLLIFITGKTHKDMRAAV
jgi:uncharacterized membrane protein